MKPLVPALICAAGCAVAPGASLVDDLQRADVTGCSRVSVWAWLRGDDEQLSVSTFIPVGEELDAVFDPGEPPVWDRDLSDKTQASLGISFAADLSQNGPCSHLPLPVTLAGKADTGRAVLTLLEGAHGEPGNTYATVELMLEGVEAELDDGERVALPDVTWTGVEVFLDAE